MSKAKPAFLITIDTEGDNLWSMPETITTKNSYYLPRFQELCERYGLKPTWLTAYEMAMCPDFREFGIDVLRRRTGEIGMHLHAWNSPPIKNYDPKIQSYLIEYPEKIMREKIKFMTDLLENSFHRKMVSHRAGRWALNSIYVHSLIEYGYMVDCSVTPHVSWSSVVGNPGGSGGTDYMGFPTKPYFMDPDRIEREGDSILLEVPVSIVKRYAGLHRITKHTPYPIRHALQRYFPPTVQWLRPNGRNLDSMLEILESACNEKWSCVEFMLHSSELMPGGSPTFQTNASVEGLYDDLEKLFSKSLGNFEGATLSEFYDLRIIQHRNTLE